MSTDERVGSTEARVQGRKEVKLDREIRLGSLVLEQKMSYKYLDRLWKWAKVKREC